MNEPQFPAVTTPPGVERLTFADEIVAHATEFARRLLERVPELEGVAVVPSCTLSQHNVAAGIIVGRCGPLQQPAEIMHMAVQLHRCLRLQLDNAWSCVREIDQYMSQRQQLLEQLENEIRDREQQLALLTAQSGD